MKTAQTIRLGFMTAFSHPKNVSAIVTLYLLCANTSCAADWRSLDTTSRLQFKSVHRCLALHSRYGLIDDECTLGSP